MAQFGPIEALRGERKRRPPLLMKSAPPTLVAGSALLRRRQAGSRCLQAQAASCWPGIFIVPISVSTWTCEACGCRMGRNCAGGIHYRFKWLVLGGGCKLGVEVTKSKQRAGRGNARLQLLLCTKSLVVRPGETRGFPAPDVPAAAAVGVVRQV